MNLSYFDENTDKNLRVLKIFLGFIIFFLFLFLVLKQNLLYSFIENLKLLNKTFLLLAFIFYLNAFFLRSFRLKILEPHISFLSIFSMIGINTFLNNILPARLGELSLPILLKRKHKINYLKGGSYLLLLRILDFLSLFSLFFISFIFFFINHRINLSIFSKTFSVCKHNLIIFGFLFLFVMVFTFYILKKVLLTFKSIHEVRKIIINIKKRDLLKLSILSLFIWIDKFLYFYLIFKALNYDFSYLATIFLVSFAEITTILPIHSFGGFGSFELGIIQGGYLLNMNIKSSFKIGFFLHIFLLFFSLSIFLLSVYLYFSHKEDINNRDQRNLLHK